MNLKSRSTLLLAGISAMLLGGFLFARFARAEALRGTAVRIDREAGTVRFFATVHPDAMSRPLGVQGHHAIVWENGRAWPWALFRAEASDLEIRRALDLLGARAGENLSVESWTERTNPKNSDPDKVVEGTTINVLVRFAGSVRPVPLNQLLDEERHPHARLDLRYGGNERHRDEFKSGCIVCLYSCPGGAIGNRIHPIRDYVRDGVVYHARTQRLPKRGSRAEIILEVRKETR